MKPSFCNKECFNAQEQLFLQVFEKNTYFAATSEVRQALHKCGTWKPKRAVMWLTALALSWFYFLLLLGINCAHIPLWMKNY